MDKFTIKLANQKHCKKIWEWRNDEITRSMSINSAYISWIDHKNWYKKIINDTTTYLFVGYLDNELIGVSRFDRFENSTNNYRISININPNKRGYGIGKMFLAETIENFWEEVPDVDSLIAEIKKENIASIKTFKINNFKLEKNFQNIERYRLYRI